MTNPPNAMKNIPQIRFKGFQEEWVKTTLGNCFLERIERSLNGELLSVTMASGVVKASDLDRLDNSSSDKSNYKVVCIGDIAYNSMRMWQGASGYSAYNGICSPAYTVVSPTEGIDVVYFSYLFKCNASLYQFRIHSQGLTSDTWNLKYPAFSKLDCAVPSVSEQRKIGLLLTTLDTLIRKLELKLDKLRKLKQALLNKMFINVNRGGYAVPAIRFKGYNDEWEKKRLGEVLSESIIYGLNAKATTYDGVNKYLRITDIDDETREFSQDNLTSPDIKEPAEVYKLKTDDIVLARTGATVGKSYIYKENVGTTFFAGFLLRARVSELYDANFVFSATLTRRYTAFVQETSQRSSQPGINAREFSVFSFFLPCLSEQKQIGKYFGQMDVQLQQSSAKLTKLRTMKQSLLQKMFV